MTLETTMELDELRQAWQALDRQLQQQKRISLELFTETRMRKAKRGLRWLQARAIGQVAVGLVVTLLSEMPSTSAISRVLRSSRYSSSNARLSGSSVAMKRCRTRSAPADSWSIAPWSATSCASSRGTACRRRWLSLRRKEIATFNAMRYIQVENRRVGS